MERAWRETIGGTMPAAGPWFELSPATSGTDGFFVAVLERER
jgi:16S rRNA C967 or C1407 C5-methylase (RsmB/RsmF family)